MNLPRWVLSGKNVLLNDYGDYYKARFSSGLYITHRSTL